MDINALLTSYATRLFAVFIPPRADSYVRLNGRKYIVGDRTNPISLYEVSDSRGQIQMGSAADQPATQVKSVVVSLQVRFHRIEPLIGSRAVQGRYRAGVF